VVKHRIWARNRHFKNENIRPFSGLFGKITKLSNWYFFARKSNDLGKMGNIDALSLLTFYTNVIILWLFHKFFHYTLSDLEEY